MNAEYREKLLVVLFMLDQLVTEADALLADPGKQCRSSGLFRALAFILGREYAEFPQRSFRYASWGRCQNLERRIGKGGFMAPREVECERCGSGAIVKRIEAELDLGKHKSIVILIIDCPECGEREQHERMQSQGAAR